MNIIVVFVKMFVILGIINMIYSVFKICKKNIKLSGFAFTDHQSLFLSLSLSLVTTHGTETFPSNI